MKKLFLAFLTIPLMAVQCSNDETPTADCNCERVEYKYDVIGWTSNVEPIWGYKEIKRTPTDLNCESEIATYQPITGAYYFKIECN